MRSAAIAALAAVLIVGPGCRSASRPPTTAAPAPATGAMPPASARPAGGADELPAQLRWVRRSAEYQALVVQAYRAATRHVERAAYGRTPGSWAVVLDADETVISNLVYQEELARDGRGYSDASWLAWVRRKKATALPGAKAFLDRVRALGGRIAIVTNRPADGCDDTKDVFASHDLIYDAMLCKPPDGSSDKNPRFDAVSRGEVVGAPGPVDVIAFLGDNIQDFPGLSQSHVHANPQVLTRFGERYFVLPNPMYGSWER